MMVEMHDDDEGLATIVYETIIEQHNNMDDIIDDLDDKKNSYIIQKISGRLRDPDEIEYEWTDDDETRLYFTLREIYINGITEEDEFDQSMIRTQVFIDKVMNIVEELNETMKNKIPTGKVKKMLQDEEVSNLDIQSITPSILEPKATEYGLKPHHVWKIFNKLKPNSPEQVIVSPYIDLTIY